MAEISVIIPCYNIEKYLALCLDSLLAQTFSDFEAICINDGSTDNTLSILEEYAKKDNRIKVISQVNQGQSIARNQGLIKATGNFIFFLDSDDEIHPQCLEIAYTFSQKYDAQLICFKLNQSQLNSQNVQFDDYFDIDKIAHKISLNPVMLGCHKARFNVDFSRAKLYARELLDNIQFLPNNQFEDVPHTYEVLAKKPKTIILDAELYLYRILETSSSHQKNIAKHIKDYWDGINYVYNIYNTQNLRREFEFLKRNFIPIILKQQLGRCKHSKKEVRPQMFKAFAEELRDLDKKGLISWRGHKLSRYLIIRKLIKKGG